MLVFGETQTRNRWCSVDRRRCLDPSRSGRARPMARTDRCCPRCQRPRVRCFRRQDGPRTRWSRSRSRDRCSRTGQFRQPPSRCRYPASGMRWQSVCDFQGENPVLCAPPRPPHRWHRTRRSVALARCRLRPRHRSACSPACLMPALDTVHFSRDPPRSTAAADTEGLVARIALARTPPPAKTSPRWTFFRGWRARSRPADMPALGRTGQTRAGYRPCSRPRFCATELPNADPSCLVALGM